MLLWVSIAIFTVVATAVIVWPLLSRRDFESVDSRDDERRRLAVFRHRKHELERERRAGRLADDEAAQAQEDLLRQLADDLAEPAVAASAAAAASAASASASASAASAAPAARVVARASPASAWLVAVVVATLVPLIALGVYRQVGAPELASMQPASAPGPVDPAQVEAMIAQIEQRTRENPDDGEAWAMLGEARKMQGRHADAVPAFEKAIQKLPDDARLLADYAESAALLAGGDFAGRPIELLERALKADPGEPRAIALMGAAQYRLGNLERASGYLTQLQRFLTPGGEEAIQIADVLRRIDGEIAHRKGGVGSGGIGSGSGEGPTATTQAPAGDERLAGTVTIDPSLSERAPAGATLYVVARLSGGPPIPIAALRVQAAGFPASFALDDSNAMDPSRRLSGAASIDLEARLSRSGNAMRQPGDLFGQLAGVRPGQRDLKIVIDRVVAP